MKMGGGLREEIYQQSLEKELVLRNIPFATKKEIDVFYKGQKLGTKYIPDLVVHEKMIVELKAVSALVSDNEAQLMNYMRITRSPIGYLINFGPIGKLEYKRVILSDLFRELRGRQSTLMHTNVAN
ncbi:MAG: GxxExxY protein [Pirellulaceae bacterium]